MRLKFLLVLMLIPSLCFGSASRDFDGTGDLVCKEDPTLSDFPSSQPVGVAIWLFPDTVTGFQALVLMGERTGTDSGWRIALNEAVFRFTTLNVKDYETALTATISEWQLITASLDSGFDVTFRHYLPSTNTLTINKRNHTADMNPPSAGSDFMVGATQTTTSSSCGTTSNSLDGQLAYAQVYKQTFTETDVRQLMFLPDSIPNVAYWTLWGDSPEPDLSINSNVGTITNATTSTNGPPVMFGGGLPL